MIRILAFTAFLALAVSASAINVDGSPYGSIAVEVSRDPNNANSVWVKTISRTGNVRSPGTTYDVRLRILRTSAGDSVTLANFTGQGSYNEGGLVASYSTSSTAYLWFNVWNWSDGQAAQAVIGPVTIDAAGTVGLPPALQYGGSFSIPGNPTDHPVKYDVVQGGNVVGSVVQQPGAGPILYNVPGLQSGTPLHLKEITPGIKATPGGGFEADPGGPGYEREVGVTIPTQGSGGGGSTPAPVVSPTAPTAPSGGGAPVPPAPTVVNVNVDAPLKPVWVPKGEVAPGTTPGQSTSDFTISAYREGVDKQVAGWRAEAQRMIDGEKANTTTLDATLKAGAADAKAAATAANEKLEQIRINTQSTADKLTGIKSALDAQAAAPVKLVENPSSYDTNWRSSQLTAAKSAADAATYSGASVTGDSVTVSGDSFSAATLGSVNVAGADVKFSLSPSDMGAAASGFSIFTACRGLLLLAACIGFIYSCSDTVNVYVASLGNAGAGGQGLAGIENAVPGVTQAKHLASASAVALAVMAGAAAIVAFVDTVAGRYGVGLSSMLNAMDLGPIGPAYGFLDQFFPVAAITALAVLRAAFPYFVAPVYLGAASAARFLHI